MPQSVIFLLNITEKALKLFLSDNLWLRHIVKRRFSNLCSTTCKKSEIYLIKKIFSPPKDMKYITKKICHVVTRPIVSEYKNYINPLPRDTWHFLRRTRPNFGVGTLWFVWKYWNMRCNENRIWKVNKGKKIHKESRQMFV